MKWRCPAGIAPERDSEKPGERRSCGAVHSGSAGASPSRSGKRNHITTKAYDSMRSHTRPKRVRSFERLETRRLLVGEGDVFQINESLPNNGLLGDVSGEVRWGDGSTDTLSLSGDQTVEGVKVVFDYDLDDNKFFNQPGAKQALQYAADSIASRFRDQLSEIRPSPAGLPGLSYRPYIQHPSQGPADEARGNLVSPTSKRNVVVKANEIRLFAGGRDLRHGGGIVAAIAGTGSVKFDDYPPTLSEAEQKKRKAEFEARGQAGAIGNSPTDIAPTFGQISFNTTFDWDFSTDGGPAEPGKQDFLAIAMHELAHAFGFGTSAVWSNQVNGGKFTGKNAVKAYQGSGGVPLDRTKQHWDGSVFRDHQPTLLTGTIQTSKGRALSVLDMAALKDVGWDVSPEGKVSFTAAHRYADNGVFDVSVVLRGSQGGEQVYPIKTTTIDNAAPTLSTSTAQPSSVLVGANFDITDIGVVTDAGINDTFTYEISWGDDTTDHGDIDSIGDSATSVSFNGSHEYKTEGVKTVTLTVIDKDGASAEESFQITVNPPPTLALRLNRPEINEDDGTNAATLTVTRSGPPLTGPQRVKLQSSDTSELTLPEFAEIPAGASQVLVQIEAVDDALLDETQTVTISASGSLLVSDEISIDVADREQLFASFSDSKITEGGAAVVLRLERSNTDHAEDLEIGVSGIDRARFEFDGPLVIPAGNQLALIQLTIAENETVEQPQSFDARFLAAGYVSSTATITIIDNEPRPFQNPSNQFDVNNDSTTTASDALLIINAIARRGGNFTPGPQEQPDGGFFDVSGDFQVTPLDALQVINMLARQAVSENELELASTSKIRSALTIDRLHDDAIGLMF